MADSNIKRIVSTVLSIMLIFGTVSIKIGRAHV